MNKKYDALVIGGGISGLSSAAYLAKAGKKVAVFEQHKKPGGYYTSFTRGVIFDISTHWAAFPHKINEMLEELNVQTFEFALHEPVGHYMGPDKGSDIILNNDMEKFEDSILKTYPGVNRESLNKLVQESLAIENELMQATSESVELMSIFSLKQWKQKNPFIQGLYQAGHWIEPSGVPSVIYSGKMLQN